MRTLIAADLDREGARPRQDDDDHDGETRRNESILTSADASVPQPIC